MDRQTEVSLLKRLLNYVETRITSVTEGPWRGLINDIPSVKELIDRIMREAEEIIRGRIESFLNGRPSALKVA